MRRKIARLVPRLSSGRTALFLYVMLVVLPAAVFGGLLWIKVRDDQARQLASIPADCDDAAERLALSSARRVRSLLDRQQQHPFEYFREEYYSEDGGVIQVLPSPLAVNSRPTGVLGWFSFHAKGYDVAGSPRITVLRGNRYGVGGSTEGAPDAIELRIEEVVRREFVDQGPFDILPAKDALHRLEQTDGASEVVQRPLRSAILNLASEEVDLHRSLLESDLDLCLGLLESDPELLKDVWQPFHMTVLEIRVVDMGKQQLPWVIAYRDVVMEGLFDPRLPTCMGVVDKDVMLTQGIVLDPGWLFVRLPKQEATSVLGPSLRFAPPGERRYVDPDRDPDLAFAIANVLGYLDDYLFPGTKTAQLGSGFVIGDAGVLRSAFRVQNAWFGGVALVLSISMAIGIRLLLSSIRRSNAEAERTRNFVASVTHELRTPIAAVKLYGEMLRDGWITDDVRRAEYLSRIVLESDRLDGLVDRVLLRRKLSDANHAPHAGDLNAEVEQLRAGLEMVGGSAADDIVFELAPDLPKVLVLYEGIHVVLTNLVENARKYAPVAVAAGDVPPERLIVSTRLSRKGRVLLEVLDRGPGIAEGDRERIFEAFLRLGDEHTRRTKGTGLGLHLVALQAHAMGAKVRALPRTGGGTVFQVLFSRA